MSARGRGRLRQNEPMPKQEPFERVRNFDEVALGYTAELAREEASRCLACKKPGCVDGCPVGIDIPGFIELHRRGRLRGRHQEDQGDQRPARRLRPGLPAGGAVREELRAGQEGRAGGHRPPRALPGRLGGGAGADRGAASAAPATARSVAVVGSGPAGITVAADLALLGYEVTMFEALHEAGGVLTYGIPEFRLPKAIVRREVDVRAQPGRRAAPRLRRRQDAHRRRAARTRSTPSSSAPAPACPGSWRSPARTSTASTRPTST